MCLFHLNSSVLFLKLVRLYDPAGTIYSSSLFPNRTPPRRILLLNCIGVENKYWNLIQGMPVMRSHYYHFPRANVLRTASNVLFIYACSSLYLRLLMWAFINNYMSNFTEHITIMYRQEVKMFWNVLDKKLQSFVLESRI